MNSFLRRGVCCLVMGLMVVAVALSACGCGDDADHAGPESSAGPSQGGRTAASGPGVGNSKAPEELTPEQKQTLLKDTTPPTRPLPEGANVSKLLSQIENWQVLSGTWVVDEDGRFTGGPGPGQLRFRYALPRDGYIECDMFTVCGAYYANIRITHEGTGLIVGNRHQKFAIEAWGCNDIRQVLGPLSDAKASRVGVEFTGDRFTLYVNGERTGHGVLERQADRNGFRLHTGFGGNHGRSIFSNFLFAESREQAAAVAAQP